MGRTRPKRSGAAAAMEEALSESIALSAGIFFGSAPLVPPRCSGEVHGVYFGPYCLGLVYEVPNGWMVMGAKALQAPHLRFIHKRDHRRVWGTRGAAVRRFKVVNDTISRLKHGQEKQKAAG